MLYQGVVLMKSFTRSHVLKSGTVEVVSPRIVNIIPTFSSAVLAKEAFIDYQETNNQDSFQHHALNSEEENQILAEAYKKAEKIIAEAQKYSSEIIKEAEAEKNKLREELEESLRREVIPKAYSEGYEKGLQEAKEESKQIKQQAEDYLQLAETALADEFQRVDQELIHLSLKLSEKIIGSSLTFDSRKLLGMINELTLLPHKKQGLKIYVSQADFEWLNQLSEEERPPYQIILDQSLRRGDTYLESEEGIFDARLDSQLEKLEQALLEELENGGLDSTSQ